MNDEVHMTDIARDNTNLLETLFAGLSVFFGILAVVVGLLQLLKYRTRRHSSGDVSIHELEAILPVVPFPRPCKQCQSANWSTDQDNGV